MLLGFNAAKYAPTKFALEQLQPPALIVLVIADLKLFDVIIAWIDPINVPG